MIILPKGIDLNSLLLFLKETGVQSSSLLRKFDNELIPLYVSGDNSQLKNIESDLVTSADLTINKLFLDKFSENYPNANWEIITEENSKGDSPREFQSNWVWLIDPLDGTKDFIQKTGEYAIHVALLFKNEPILGMVLLPGLQEMWFGVKGIGTWKEKESLKKENKNLETFSKKEAFNLVTSKNHSNEKLAIILEELNFLKVTRMGSIGYKICSLLRNEAEVYISISGKTSPKDWDIAAPHSLIAYSKCNFTYASGSQINYFSKEYLQTGCLIASTLLEKEHYNLCEKVNSIIKKYNL